MPTTRASRQRSLSKNAIVGGILAALDVNTGVTNNNVTRKAALKEMALPVSEWSNASNGNTPKQPCPDVQKKQSTPPPSSVIISSQLLSPDASACVSELSGTSVEKRKNTPKILFSGKYETITATTPILPQVISYQNDEDRLQKGVDVGLERYHDVEYEENDASSEYTDQEESVDTSDFSSENEFDSMHDCSIAADTKSEEQNEQGDSDFINDDDETVDENSSLSSCNESKTEFDEEYAPDDTDEDDSVDGELDIDDDDEVSDTKKTEKSVNQCEVDVIAEILHDTHVNEAEVVAIAVVVTEKGGEEESFLTFKNENHESHEDEWTNSCDDDDDNTVPFDDETSKTFDDATGSFDYESDGSNAYEKSTDIPSENCEPLQSGAHGFSFSRAKEHSVLEDYATKEINGVIFPEVDHKVERSIIGCIDNEYMLASASLLVDERSCLEQVKVETVPEWYEVAETPLIADFRNRESNQNACASQQQSHVDSLLDSSTCQPNKSVTVDRVQRSDNHLSPLSEREAHSIVFTLVSSKKHTPPNTENLTNKVTALSKICPQIKREKQREGTIRRGRWALGSKIGSGSFGVVHVGMNMETGQLIAIKSIEVSPAAMRDIRCEIEVLKSLEHINIVRYLGAERDKKKLHIFQEWVPGGSVVDLINKFGAFSFPVIRRYLSQVLTGLTYLHKNGILHRDIKGGNVLINNDGIVRLADFGASKRLAHQQADLMETLTMRGTPYFMAPEVFEEKYGGKADVWSVGCVGFQMATGSPPWKGQGFTNPISLFSHLRKSEGPPPINWPENVPMRQSEKEFFEVMLAKCFRREPSQRPTAHELQSEQFFFEINPSEDELSCSQGLFSPVSQEHSQFAPLMSPPLKWNPSKRLTPFTTPPLPVKIRASTLCQDIISPMLQSPKADSSNWPTWVCVSEKKSAVCLAQKESTMIDSLARSEDSGQNPFGRQCCKESEIFQHSDESFSMLNGLRFLDKNIKEN